MIDKQAVKERANLFNLAGCSGMRKVATSGGGEWAGACPACGGDDRFRVQPYHQPEPRWMCRHCTAGKWKNAIDFVMLVNPGMGFVEACGVAVGGDLPTTNRAPEHRVQPEYQPPADEWQSQARAVVKTCEAALWDPRNRAVLDYLRGRGLEDKTIRRFRLGYNRTGAAERTGRQIEGLYVPRGIVIPCIVRDTVWYLKIRFLPDMPVKCSTKDCRHLLPGPGQCPKCGKVSKYTGVKGNRTAAIFNADALTGAELAIFCEGEIDCMLAWQEVRDVAPAVTIGGAATNRPDLATWGRYLRPLRLALAAYDSDRAGEDGAAALADLMGDKVKLAPVPFGKDINDYYLRGGDLWDWLDLYLHGYDPLEAESPLDYLLKNGGQRA